MIWKKLCDFTRFLSIRLYVTMPSGNGEVKRLNRRNSPKTGWTHLWILLGLCRKALPSWVSKADSFLGSNLSSTFQKANLRSSLSWTSPTSRFCRPFTGRIKRIDLAGQQALASSRTRTTPWSQMRDWRTNKNWSLLSHADMCLIIRNHLQASEDKQASEFLKATLRVQHPQCLESATLDNLSLRRLTWLCHHRIERFEKSQMLTASVWFSALHLSLLHYYTILYMI